MNYYIKPSEWEQILLKLRSRKDIRTKNESKLRTFVEAIWYVVRSGCQWRLLPPYYGSWRAVHDRFQAWSKKKIWDELFQSFHCESDMEYTMIDATIVRAHACAAGLGKNTQEQEALGRSKGGFTSKIHALVDALGNPIKFILTAGQRNDITQATNLTSNLKETVLIADKGYDSNDFIQHLNNNECTAIIPPKKNRKEQREYDKHVYKERHLVECFFSKIKHFRRIFSRFDKSADIFLSFLNFVGALIWMR